MSFGLQILRFTETVEKRRAFIQQRTTELCFSSIVEGSPVSGAPGQPVDTGALKASWSMQVENYFSTISTNLIYAPQIEDGTREGRRLTLRSKVGGFYSVRLTAAAWPKIVAFANAEAQGVI